MELGRRIKHESERTDRPERRQQTKNESKWIWPSGNYNTVNITASYSYIWYLRFEMFPKTYEAGFFNSLGVAIGSMIMTTRLSLSTFKTTVTQEYS